MLSLKRILLQFVISNSHAIKKHYIFNSIDKAESFCCYQMVAYFRFLVLPPGSNFEERVRCIPTLSAKEKQLIIDFRYIVIYITE